MHRISDTGTDGQGTDITPASGELLIDANQVVFAHWHDFDRVGEFEVGGTGVDIGR